MSDIPTIDVQEFFASFDKKIKIIDFDVPEPNYENGNISFFETVIICLLCKNLSPIKILEFGTFNGRTTINIAANVPEDAHIITVDLPKPQMNKTKFPLEGIGLDDEHDELGYVGLKNKRYNKHPMRLKSKIEQFWMDTADFPSDDYQEAFDFIFVDASHTYSNTYNDSYTALRCIKEKGVILWHDYNGWPGVTKALNELLVMAPDPTNYVHIEGTSLVAYYANTN